MCRCRSHHLHLLVLYATWTSCPLFPYAPFLTSSSLMDLGPRQSSVHNVFSPRIPGTISTHYSCPVLTMHDSSHLWCTNKF
ncbi:hypothetical protein BJV74DRAFT_556526 [Russula compacta]|nr:hypothetical protein BJV74DRAFT_556526 [Russula compacta]